MPDQMYDIRFAAGEEVIDAEDVVTFQYQAITQMRAQKACAARHQNRLSLNHSRRSLFYRPTSKKARSSIDARPHPRIGPDRAYAIPRFQLFPIEFTIVVRRPTQRAIHSASGAVVCAL